MRRAMKSGRLKLLIDELLSIADVEKAALLARFFKTGPGEYGHGDVFLGITVPAQRKVARKFRDLPAADLGKLLASPIHEHRVTALIIMVDQYERADDDEKQCIFDFYLSHTKHINNWDLVDASAPCIVGGHLLGRPRKILDSLARSSSLWERRIAILATFAFIRHGESGDSLRIAELLLKDEHDLIHKAVGWMLREVGKRDPAALDRFLDRHATTMPRTMLRYAIERMSPDQRWFYMRKA